jgi:Reverse transcriptase (RNA-dependent DNA polymerase)
MDGQFTRKARFVANGNEPRSIESHNTYASVVTRESVRIASFLYATLNDLQILGCYVSNAYQNAPCREKIWVNTGPEFGSDEGKVMIVRKALYGLKSSGFSWKKTLTQNLEDMGYKSSIADPDVFIQPAAKPDGTKYYEFLLTYVNDCLCVSACPENTMDVLGKIYDLKDTVKPPERYLGANIIRWQLNNGRECWAMLGKDYVKNAVRICKDLLAEDQQTLRTGQNADRLIAMTYRPELDVTPVLGTKLASRYQQLIGILRWAVELGQVDILLEVSLMPSYLCQPREGHLEAVYNVFAYLSKHGNAPMAFDDAMPRIVESAFHQSNWSDSIYGEVEEELPPKMPKPLGNPVIMTYFVDANHSGDKVTRRSQTGFIIYLNNAPIDWFSKKHYTCESSTLGSELVAMRLAMERIKALRYKLRMFRIPIEGPTNILGDNESVVNSALKVEARLNKKNNAICFHAVREAAAANWIRVRREPTETNIADIFTKMLDTGGNY